MEQVVVLREEVARLEQEGAFSQERHGEEVARLTHEVMGPTPLCGYVDLQVGMLTYKWVC